MNAGTPAHAFSDSLLRQMVEDALADAAPNAALTSAASGGGEPAASHWALASQLGWLGTLVPEEAGGMGLGLLHIADLCEVMGRNLFCGPFVETAVLLPVLACEIGGEFGQLLPDALAGTAQIGFCEVDEADVGEAAALSVSPVEHALSATHFLFFREASDGRVSLMLARSADAEVTPLQAMDLTCPVARVDIEASSARIWHTPGEGGASRILTALHVAIAADLLGTGEAALARTVDHVRGRKQFGTQVGAFQAIKHRLADCYMALSGARLAISHAARDQASSHDAVLARVLAGDAARKATSAAIQLHGALGFSWEVDLHLYLKRMLRLSGRNGGANRLRAEAGATFIDTLIEERH